MRKYLIILNPFIMQQLICCMLAIHAGAQNYIPNGNFEEKTLGCPYYLGGMTGTCMYWHGVGMRSVNGVIVQFQGDYFYPCGPFLIAHVPKNIYGYQHPASGLAYVGVQTDTLDSPTSLKVNIGPLVPGVRYQASMSVSLADSSRYATENIGIKLTRWGYTNEFRVPFKHNGPITDTANWTRISATIVNDAPYDYMEIGMFGGINKLTKVSNYGNYAYYYVDSVVVRPCRAIDSVLVPDTTCAGWVNVPYKTDQCDLDTANVFTIELSSYTGAFDLPMFPTKVLGSYKSNISDTFRLHIPEGSFYSKDYRLRVTATHPVDTFYTKPFTIYPQPLPVAFNTGPACEGDGIQLSVSGLGTSYTWTGPNGFSLNRADTIIFNPGLSLSGKYVVTVHYNNCVGSDSTEVLIKPLPAIPIVSASNPACEGQELLLDILNAETGTIYLWTGPDSFYSNDIHVVIPGVQQSAAGNYRARADKNGCNTEKDIAVTVQPVFIPEILSNSPVHAGSTLSLETANPKTGASYEWKGPNNFFSSSQNEYILKAGAQHAGIYYLTAAFKGCTATASTVVDVIIPKDTGYIKIYPNPNKGSFTIEGYLKTENKIPFYISNAGGQIVYTGSLEMTGKLLKKDIVLPAVADGSYFLKLWIDQREKIFPFTVIQ